MKNKEQAFAVVAICLSIIIAGVIIAYKPWVEKELTQGLPENFWYPSGVGVSQGLPTLYSDISQSTDLDLKTISVTGAGSASDQADQAKVNLGVQVTSEFANDAISENAESMSAVIAAIKALDVDDEDIVTTTYSVYPQYDWTETGREFKGYTVTNLVQVTVKDRDIVGDVIDKAAEAGANQINGIGFELSDAKREDLKTKAYIAALTDARDKADVIAETLGLTITGVQKVTEYSYSPVRSYEYVEEASSMDGAIRASTPILSGDLSVSVSVHIVFLFE
jgi:uncharacterized protein YggE